MIAAPAKLEREEPRLVSAASMSAAARDCGARRPQTTSLITSASSVDVQALCATQGWKYCVISGVAVRRWGEPRQTHDVDLTLFTGLSRKEEFVDTILVHYAPRLPDGRRFAMGWRVLLVETTTGIPLDAQRCHRHRASSQYSAACSFRSNLYSQVTNPCLWEPAARALETN